MVSLLGIDPANQLVRPSLVGHVRPESCTVAVWSLTYLKFLFCGCSSFLPLRSDMLILGR